MGLVRPTLPDVDVEEYRTWSPRRRTELGVRHWAEHGFGTPTGVVLLYVVKLVGYAVGGAAVIAATTPGLGSLGDVASWWTEPVVLQKAVLWSLLVEVAGLGCGFGPLTFHFVPPWTAPLQWLRRGTTRLPPWPDRVPLTRGHTRGLVDVALYAGVLVATLRALAADPDPTRVATTATDAALGTLDPAVVVPVLALVALAGLRDKTVFLAARGEQYVVMAALCLFPPDQYLTGMTWVLVATWWGAATSKVNRHFPFVVATMISNAPGRPRAFRRALFRDVDGGDLRPSRLAAALAHGGTTIEYVVPLLMLLGGGGTLTRVAVVVMVVFHLHIISALPLGVPLEWNVFFIVAAPALFWVHTDVALVPQSPWLALVLVVALVAVPVYGSLRPDRVSFLPAMRYYAGNWATSVWLLTPAGEEKLHAGIRAVSPPVRQQLGLLYDDATIDLLGSKALAFRAMHSHGRALHGLVPRAVDDEAGYERHEGELVAGIALGWNFGDGHLHDGSLLAALQAQCGFAPGEVRVVSLESQPIHRPTQRYRILDGADGVLEEGTVRVADMVVRQPWLAEGELPFPVTVEAGATGW